MFTGIIEAVGLVAAIQQQGIDARVTVQVENLDMADVGLGDSIAVNGVCLTVVKFDAQQFEADVSGETLSKTAFANVTTGSRVNLEKALTPTTRLGGHLVSGHVDGVGEVVSRKQVGDSVVFAIKAPDELAKYIAPKGSITVDGISLTVNVVNGAVFTLNTVPHTVAQTTMDSYQAGSQVNLEVDLLARYLERLMLGDKAVENGITEVFLQEHGFGNG